MESLSRKGCMLSRKSKRRRDKKHDDAVTVFSDGVGVITSILFITHRRIKHYREAHGPHKRAEEVMRHLS